MPWETHREDAPRPIGRALRRELERLGGPSPAVLDVLWAEWERVVGEAVAAHVEPVSFRNGTLTVAVDAPAWATQLRLLSDEVLGRLNEAAGEVAVRALEVRVRG